MGAKMDWRGDAVKAKALAAAKAGIDATTSRSVGQAKSNHPGWKNQTGTAEGSVQMRGAQIQGTRVVGRWGSFSVDYVIWLELKHGSFLRRAADATYPGLPAAIRAAMR